jgi:hypothetical protein
MHAPLLDRSSRFGEGHGTATLQLHLTVFRGKFMSGKNTINVARAQSILRFEFIEISKTATNYVVECEPSISSNSSLGVHR